MLRQFFFPNFDHHLLGDINWGACVKLDVTGTVNNLKQILSCRMLRKHTTFKTRRKFEINNFFLVHIHALTFVSRVKTAECAHVLLEHQFINTVPLRHISAIFIEYD
jgi:hypothetical protein